MVKDNKGQMKIQEMAFVLVAIMVFFGIVAIFYFKVSLSNLKGNVEIQRSEEANELVLKMAATPEFSFTGRDCNNCVDLDKILILKERQSYKNFWNLDYLKVEVIYPNRTGECYRNNYPECGSFTIINKTQDFGIPKSAYVSLCRQESKDGSHVKCELGRIYASGKGLDGVGQ